MGRLLRLGFVMGGGVSLGTFSGAALAETIKQQLVYGQYNTGELDATGQPIFQPYERIEIDVLSGASAGAISLALLLRVLSNPKDQYRLLGYRTYEDLKTALEKQLLQQFGSDLLQLQQQWPIKYEQLFAAQTLLLIQKQVWTKEVDLQRLLGTGLYEKDLSQHPSFMDRSIVDELAAKFFPFESKEAPLEHKTLLADRVLFGCTLANLSHTLSRSKRQLPQGGKYSFIQALNDSSVDRIHSELRIFDLNFKSIEGEQHNNYPLQWVQYHTGDFFELQAQSANGSLYPKTVHSLQETTAWQELTATAIASAAVPIAFEPVVLQRYRYEFGKSWPKALAHKESYPFTYVDGGVFNNEPIQEALQLTAYLDALHLNEAVDRQVVFIDPDVSELEDQFRIQAHETLSIGRSIFSSKIKVSNKPSILRLLSSVSHLLTAVLNEAQSVETSRLADVMDQLERRQQLRQFFRHHLIQAPDNTALNELRGFVQKELDLVRNKLLLPEHSLQVQHEFLRIVKEEQHFLKNHLPLDDERALVDQINQFVYLPEPAQVPNAPAWAFVLSCLALDVSIGLVNKSTHTQLIPIAPFNFYDTDGTLELLALPGKGMAGFTGFASFEASCYEVEYGRYCVKRILQELQLISRQQQQQLLCPPPFDERQLDGLLVEQVQDALVKRIKEMVPSGFVSLLPFLNGYLRESVLQLVQNNLRGKPDHCSFEFHIRVPNDLYVLRAFTLDGAALPKYNIQTVRIHGDYYLITKLNYSFEEEQWIGNYTNFMQSIYIDRSKFFDDLPAISIELPAMSLEHDGFLAPHAIFKTDIRHALDSENYKELSAKHWEYQSTVKPLDQQLWRKKRY